MTRTTQNDRHEEGIEVPWERIDPDTLYNMVSEFVTREWEESGDVSHTLEQKIGQVLGELRHKRARVVFDAVSESCNIVACR
ncbi:YheU family protein [Geobacter sp. SVR]|uniref:YheU family protein n=1 Tax=Geobacter sp. SVR TaxID=2495594 RepID=UPI00143EF8FA|nr:YheU family protein [Geobacter sp. SVR]BCS54596.1 hypothetical protein GSVR_29040 [Geobacter sp. SVR]GCF86897.1 UPF0270 protein [Geobacter sp. SVR]